MKSYCKSIDISDPKFIESAIWDCLIHRDPSDYYRDDVQRVIGQYGTIDRMAEQMSHDIKARKLNLPPVIEDRRIDKSNGKLREIAIEDIWQQFYDYVAAHGLEPSLARLGYYQCGCVEGKGQIWGIKMLHGWMQKYKYFSHSDIRKCYPSIPQNKLFTYLEKFVANEELIWLIRELVTHTTPKGGISIGSRLSITLCQLYLSQIYHHMEGCYKIRRGKKKPIVQKILIFMDDIYLASNSTADLWKAQKEMTAYSRSELGLDIKPDWKIIDAQSAALDAMGFKLNRDYTKMRRINYLRTKRSLNAFRKNPSYKNAKTLVTRTTNIKYSNSYHFRKKYNWKQASREARRIISHEDKIHNKTANGVDSYRWQYSLLPDSPERSRGGCGRPADRRDA